MVHFAPKRVVHFTPKWVVHFERNHHLLWLIIPFSILCIPLWELTNEYTVYSLIIVIPLFLFLLYKWFRKAEKRNEAVEREIIFEYLNPIINKDIVLFGDTVVEIERKYVINEDDDYKTSRYLLVLLSNGEELRYNIINLKRYDKIQVCEIDINAKRIE